jgi:hypothetical protein
MRDDPVSNGIVHQLRDRVQAQFSVDVDPMRFHSSDADLQSSRGLFARHAVCQEAHNFALAFRQLCHFNFFFLVPRRGSEISAQHQFRESRCKKMPLFRDWCMPLPRRAIRSVPRAGRARRGESNHDHEQPEPSARPWNFGLHRYRRFHGCSLFVALYPEHPTKLFYPLTQFHKRYHFLRP